MREILDPNWILVRFRKLISFLFRQKDMIYYCFAVVFSKWFIYVIFSNDLLALLTWWFCLLSLLRHKYTLVLHAFITDKPYRELWQNFFSFWYLCFSHTVLNSPLISFYFITSNRKNWFHRPFVMMCS